MSTFPSHLITKRIQEEILVDAEELAAHVLPPHLPPEETLSPLPPGMMLAIRFNKKRKKGSLLRVAFENRFETKLGDDTFRLGYDGACGGLPVTRCVLAYSINPRVVPGFATMVGSGFHQREVELWVLEVARLAHLCVNERSNLLEFYRSMNLQESVSGISQATTTTH